MLIYYIYKGFRTKPKSYYYLNEYEYKAKDLSYYKKALIHALMFLFTLIISLQITI